MVGVTVFRAMFPERKGAVTLGPQPERIGDTEVFVLPNPSGRNANFSYAEMLAAFRKLKRRGVKRCVIVVSLLMSQPGRSMAAVGWTLPM